MKTEAGEGCRVEHLWRHEPSEREPNPFAHITGAPHPGALVARAVAQLRAALAREYPEQEELLEPFVRAVETLVETAFAQSEADAAESEVALALVTALLRIQQCPTSQHVHADAPPRGGS